MRDIKFDRINGTLCRMVEPEPEPAKEQFEVGDWVRGKSGYDYEITAYPSKLLPDNPNVYDAIPASCMDGQSLCLELSDTESKLKPSEVIVKIGCLSGTIAKSSDPNYFLMLHSRPITNCNYSMIRFSAIDTQTREIVEGLLKAQEETNGH